MSLARQYEMKDSGVEWIGEIPCGWTISNIGSLYTQRNEKVSDKDFAPLSVTKQGVLPQLETVAKTDNGDNRKLVRAGDFAINSRSDRRGSCGIAQQDGSVSLINTVLKPRDEMHPVYYNWLFHTEQFADEFYKWGYGIVDDLWSTHWSEMKKIMVIYPPLSTQAAIAAYLDEKCAVIDGVIAETRSSIDDYKAWKASVIFEAVTKGLDPNVKMKDSGVDWIEVIPRGWTVERLKALFSFGKGLPITKEDLVERGIPVISYGQIHAKCNTGVEVLPQLLRYVDDRWLESNAGNLVGEGDFIFADTSEDLDGCGNCVYIDSLDESSRLFAGYHTITFRPKKSKRNKYLAYLFKSDAWRTQLRSRVSGVKLFSISRRMLNSATVILPPTEEQVAIVSYLDDKCATIDSVIAEKESLIAELETYKKSLIFETVTGKRRVC